MSWFKLWDEAKDDPKLRTLSDAQFRVWFSLLCMANRGKPRGTVPYCKPKILALEVAGGDLPLLESTIQDLIELDILQPEPNGRLEFTHWTIRQARKPSDEPEAIRERVAAYRARNKREVTPSNALHRVGNALVTPIEEESESESDLEVDLNPSSPPIVPPTPKEAIAARVAALPKLHDPLLDKLINEATDMLGKTLTRKQRDVINGFRNEMGDSLTGELVDYGFEAAALHSGDKLAYVFQAIRNRVNGVPKPNGQRPNGNGSVGSNGQYQEQPVKRNAREAAFDSYYNGTRSTADTRPGSRVGRPDLALLRPGPPNTTGER